MFFHGNELARVIAILSDFVPHDGVGRAHELVCAKNKDVASLRPNIDPRATARRQGAGRYATEREREEAEREKNKQRRGKKEGEEGE